MNKHLKRILDHVWGPTGSVFFHILVLVLLLKLAVSSTEEPTKVVEATMDVVAPTKAIEELTEKIDEIKDVPVVEEVIKPPDVANFAEPPRVDTVAPVVGGGGGGGGEGQTTGAGAGGTVDGSDLSDFNSIGAQSKLTLKGIYAARGGGGRRDALERYGGGASLTQATEFAVKRSLDWLKTHQYPDGSWGPSYRVAMTGLAILTYLAHDETMASPDYGDTVRKGLRYLLRSQRGNGMLVYGGWGYNGQVPVYEHAIGTYALSEAYAMTSIPFLKTSMERAVQVIIDGQNEAGSWCYNYQKGPDAPLDVSVSGWQLQALKAAYAAGAENTGLHAAIESAMRGFKSMMDKGTGMFRYSTRGEESKQAPNLCMSGIAELCMQLAGHWQDTEAQAGMKALQEMQFRWGADQRNAGSYPLYAWYYITQARFQHGGPTWNKWNKQFALPLAGMQNQDGSWCPAPGSAEAMYGPVYCTTLSALMLQVYYRFLPTYQEVKPVPEKSTEQGKGDEDIVIKFG